MTLIATPRPDGHPDVYAPSYGSIGERTTAAWEYDAMATEACDQAHAYRQAHRRHRFRGERRQADDTLAAALNAEVRAERYMRRAAQIRASKIKGATT